MQRRTGWLSRALLIVVLALMSIGPSVPANPSCAEGFDTLCSSQRFSVGCVVESTRRKSPGGRAETKPADDAFSGHGGAGDQVAFLSRRPLFVGPLLGGLQRAPGSCRRKALAAGLIRNMRRGWRTTFRARGAPLNAAARHLHVGGIPSQRRGSVKMAASKDGGDKTQSAQQMEEQATWGTLVTVGVPVPVGVWDKLLRVWMAGSVKGNKGNSRMGMRSALMPISFPLQLSEGETPKQLVDKATARIAGALTSLQPFELKLGKVECVPGVGGGWSVVVEAAENADLERLREQVSLLFPQTGSTTLFASPVESGFVTRLELANFRLRNEAYAARERLTALADAVDQSSEQPSNADNASTTFNPNAAFLKTDNLNATEISWQVKMVVVSAFPQNASEANKQDKLKVYRVAALGEEELEKCESEFIILFNKLALPGTAIGKIKKESRVADKDELRVLKSVMGDFDADFNDNREVSCPPHFLLLHLLLLLHHHRLLLLLLLVLLLPVLLLLF